MPASTEPHLRRFLVTWRASDRTIRAVGELSYAAPVFEYRYLQGIEGSPTFRPFPNFPDVTKTYRSPFLFPFFRSRVMDRRRRDFAAWRDALGLPASADDLDLLARSGGWRQGDRAAVTEEPAIGADGSTSYAFFVHGVRHRIPDPEEREQALAAACAGSSAAVRSDGTNEVNPDALLVTTPGGVDLGWVPDALVGYVRDVWSAGGQLEVLRCNGPQWPPYLRLLVEVRGRFPPDRDPLPMLPPRRAAAVA